MLIELEMKISGSFLKICTEKPHNFKISLNIMKIYGKQLKNHPIKWYNGRKIL